MKIKILSDAQNDIAKAMMFYEEQNENLGSYFLDCIMSDIESLYVYCGMHIKIANFHRLLSKRFPYAIYYEYNNKFIQIYAVLDCRQNPLFITDILKQR